MLRLHPVLERSQQNILANRQTVAHTPNRTNTSIVLGINKVLISSINSIFFGTQSSLEKNVQRTFDPTIRF